MSSPMSTFSSVCSRCKLDSQLDMTSSARPRRNFRSHTAGKSHESHTGAALAGLQRLPWASTYPLDIFGVRSIYTWKGILMERVLSHRVHMK